MWGRCRVHPEIVAEKNAAKRAGNGSSCVIHAMKLEYKPLTLEQKNHRAV